MAMVLLRVDDLTQEQAAETVFFELDADSYEIDLTAANAAHLRAQLQPYVRAARRTGQLRLPPRAVSSWHTYPPTPPLASEDGHPQMHADPRSPQVGNDNPTGPAAAEPVR
ncbi:Lsr2 family protein [Streptomyces sp. HNM0575]|uniref:Lsr2 dimerization domain-containing protein n=1 Tax=Streptomyces sp. HNM0575 TaxID=2716338 RepID=UPI00145F787B|nr:histone-like nucleoid-structuring protein Lsr2 [Streptomyces sp. HNM0575]NLU74430.1 Lsr2 family protein [Streptomyces sp. HNM0575]